MLDHEIFEIPTDRSGSPMQLVWPQLGIPAAILEFSTLQEWRSFMLSMSINSRIHRPTREKYERAWNFYYMGWVNYDFIKGGELAAFDEIVIHPSHIVEVPGAFI